MKSRTLYEIVGAPQEAPRDMVASACRRRINQLERHNDKAAAIEIAAVREAWSILGDEALRSSYDASLRGKQPESGAADGVADPLADSASALLSHALTKPRHDYSATWGRYRRYVRILGFICVFAFFAMLARPKPEPAPKAVERVQAPEAFSADKFEQEVRAREAEARAAVANEKDASDQSARDMSQAGGVWHLIDGKWEHFHDRAQAEERSK